MEDGIQRTAPRRDGLIGPEGRSYTEFRRELAPRYGLVWAQIAAGWMGLGAVALAMAALARGWPAAAWWAIPPAALAFGYAVAYLHLFLHEGAHHNLAPARRWNDRLTNLAVGLLVGQEVGRYRKVHFVHHRELGTPRDSEHSYFDALDRRFVLEGLLGVKVLHVLRGRARTSGHRAAGRSAYGGAVVAFHAAVLAAMAGLGGGPLVLAWALGLAAVFPFLGALRQLLEHRRADAAVEVDYRVTPHGAESRLFGDGPIASTFGGAGFNRHLLHHWDPQVPCTQLRALEEFLSESEAAPWLEAHRTSYAATFRTLMRW